MSHNIFKIIRKSKKAKFLAAFLAINLITQLGFPTISFALTSGPAQEEFASFEPASTSDMVSLYTGDFNYNIPLLTIPGPNGGYPINMAYHSGSGMDEEASWVGLGWCLNVGAINRQMRGLPDDYNPLGYGTGTFNVVHTMYVKPNVTASYALPFGSYASTFGVQTNSPPNPAVELYYNNYKGMGYRVTPYFNLIGKESSGLGHLGLGISYDSQTGLGIEPDLSLSGNFGDSKASLKLYGQLNTRSGLQSLGFQTKVTPGNEHGTVNGIHGADALGDNQSFSSGVSFGVGQPPAEINIPMRNEAYAANLKFGSGATYAADVWDLFQSTGFAQITANLNISKVLNGGSVSDFGYGYMYTTEAGTPGSNLTDFHRDNLPYSDNVPNLAPSAFTYDIFTQSGQGTGSTFRPYSSYNGILSDVVRNDKSNSYSLNLDFGSNGKEINARLGFDYSHGVGYSGPWQNTFGDDWTAIQGLNYSTPNSPTYPDYQPDIEDAYFQVYGEKSAFMETDDYLLNWQGDQAERIDLQEDNNALDWYSWHFTANNALDRFGNSTAFNPTTLKYKHNYQYQRRQITGTNIEWLNNANAAIYGYSKNQVYINSSGVLTPKDFVNTPQYGISEISSVQPDGMRYVYGLPTYNAYQMDATFSVWDPQRANGITNPFTNDPTKELVPTSNNIDIDPTAISATNTSQEYLSQTELKEPYANSWLLTEVLSDDYIDRTGNGPSLDDYGYWVKFDYKQTTSPSSGSGDPTAGYYHWRVPYKNSNYIEGYKNDPDDDKGTLTYGTKELYYIDSIETKTHVAVFYTSPRNDGIGAPTYSSGGIIVGGQSSASSDLMYKLDSIKLFSRASFKSSNPIPIKTVHFVYDYSLCPGVLNNSTIGAGKLTLKSLYFTYQDSKRGQSSPYQFYYSAGTNPCNSSYKGNLNPSYNDTYVDRWGTYADYDQYYTVAGSPPIYPYYDFPYTDQYQDKTNVLDKWASAWQLSSICLPTGGTINITYEMKDYAYVENQPAQDMFDIVGLGIPPVAGADDRTQATAGLQVSGTEYSDVGLIYFKLKNDPNIATAISNNTQQQYIIQNCLNNGNLQSVYFKVFNELNATGYNDYVSGYANIDYSKGMGITQVGSIYCGWLHLQKVPISQANISNTYINPITRAAIEHLRADRPELMWTAVPYTTNGWAQLANFFASTLYLIPQVLQAVAGFNYWAYSNNWCEAIWLNGYSKIRLCDNIGKKYGGGARVKQLTLSDNWTQGNYNYGQTYTYTTDGTSGGPSSGVAYEPEQGDDESALHTPVPYVLSEPLASNSHLFVENPVLKDFYPGASVGYSKVTVTSIGRSEAQTESGGSNNLTNSAAPMTVYEFYTAKDFPIIEDQTDLTDDPSIIRPFAIPGIYSSFFKRKARSQGYSVIINDMAGKMKRLAVYSQPTGSNTIGNMISEQVYTYQTTAPYNPNNVNELSNQVQVLTSNGVYQAAKIGESSEVYVDMNENAYKSNEYGGDIELDINMAPIPGVPFFFMVWPYMAQTGASMRTIVANKVIYRTGILQSVTTTTDQSKITQTNLAYDPETGEPLVTSVTNEFEDNVYNYSLPAYWYYGNMDGEYLNQGFTLSGSPLGVFTGSGVLSLNPSVFPTFANQGYVTNVSNYFTAGDQLYLTFSSGPPNGIYTVVGLYPISNQLVCIDQQGNYPGGVVTSLTVVKSGYRNLQSMKAGTVVAKTFNESAGTFAFGNVIDAKAVVYNDQWRTLCCNQNYITDTLFPTGGTTAGTAGFETNSEIQPTSCSCSNIGQTVNPFALGILGIWRPYKSYAYITNRTQANNIRTDGTYTAFNFFNWFNPAASDPKWVAANTITNYSPYGFELENENAIGVYSAATYGYANSLVTAVGSNAQYHEIGFDGFEDYPSTCDDQHFRFTTAYPNYITNTQAHTGHYSIHLAPGQSLSQEYLIESGDCHQQQFVIAQGPQGTIAAQQPNIIGGFIEFNVPQMTGSAPAPQPVQQPAQNGISPISTSPFLNIFGGENHLAMSAPQVTQTGTYAPGTPVTQPQYFYGMTNCDCMGEFFPTPGKQYVLGAWVRSIPQGTPAIPNGGSAVNNQTSPNTLPTYISPEVDVTYIPSGVTAQCFASGRIIDGWQRVDSTFTPPIGTTAVVITLKNNSSVLASYDDYFDDLRIHPFNGNLNTYVYDNVLLKVMAELDPNNYATIYNYDDEGHLTKVKKETIEGVETVKEGRINNVEN